MSLLFSVLDLGEVQLKNRIVMAPMCQYSVKQEDGVVTNWHKVHYASRAVGQVGLIIVEATAVTAQGRISPYDLGIWSDKHVVGLKELVELVHEHDAKIGIQLGHAGRKADIEGSIIAPSPIPFEENSKQPEEMSLKEINSTVEAFVEGAERAHQAGFDVLELHAAHGYLINQFLSPLTNKRNDEYGGDRDRRYRFLEEIIAQVKQVWSKPLFVRISATEYHPDGNQVEDYVYYVQKMKEQGVHLIDCSSGAVVQTPIYVYPGYQVPLAEKIKKETNILTGAVGLITSGIQAEEILQNGRADLIFLARELLRDPYWPRTAAQELNLDIEGPEQYVRGWNIHPMRSFSKSSSLFKGK